jgi:ATP/maltotriose-dependent transcriptional regulator MalT
VGVTSIRGDQVCGAPAGLSNRQIAQHLFISLATVETHLRHTFGKLGISSRAELPPALAGDEPAAEAAARG